MLGFKLEGVLMFGYPFLGRSHGPVSLGEHGQDFLLVSRVVRVHDHWLLGLVIIYVPVFCHR